MWIYLNQEWVKDDQATVSVFDRGFLFGDGIFETLQVRNFRPLFFDRHLARLHHSCAALSLTLPEPEPPWEKLVQELIDRNQLEQTMVRITISRGVGGLGPDPSGCSHPTILIFPRPMPQLTQDQLDHGVDLAILTTRRQPSSALPSHVKSLNYLNNVLAKQEATDAHMFDGLLLNTDGHLAECTTSNIFFVKDQQLHTPSLQCGILPGITREVVLELAQAEGMGIEEGNYLPKDLLDADECFLTNSGFGVLPVGTVENKQFSSHKAESVTRTIQKMYNDCIASS